MRFARTVLDDDLAGPSFALAGDRDRARHDVLVAPGHEGPD